MMRIDGSMGEGGGQVLRSSLALSIVTGTPIELVNIRAGRAKPGLMKQHLACVRAAAAISDAVVVGDELRSDRIVFEPDSVTAGEYSFAVGSAGSSILVAQTVLMPLLLAPGGSRVTFEGGTHNPKAPIYEFFERSFLPVVRACAADSGTVGVSLETRGFMPAGGGRWTLETSGGLTLAELEWSQVKDRTISAEVLANRTLADVPFDQRAELLRQVAELSRVNIDRFPAKALCNVVWIAASGERGAAIFSAIGERKRPGRAVESAIADFRRWTAADVPVGEHLADQLLLPMALGSGGTFRTLAPSLHTTTNAEVIRMFGVADVEIETTGADEATISVRV